MRRNSITTDDTENSFLHTKIATKDTVKLRGDSIAYDW